MATLASLQNGIALRPRNVFNMSLHFACYFGEAKLIPGTLLMPREVPVAAGMNSGPSGRLARSVDLSDRSECLDRLDRPWVLESSPDLCLPPAFKTQTLLSLHHLQLRNHTRARTGAIWYCTHAVLFSSCAAVAERNGTPGGMGRGLVLVALLVRSNDPLELIIGRGSGGSDESDANVLDSDLHP